MASPVLGIDLGTTNSVVAIADQQRVRVLRDDDGHLVTPSTVSFHPSGQILVGHPARERRLVDAANTVFSVKRLIGRPYRSAEVRQAAERLPFQLEEGATGGVVARVRDEVYSLPEISSFVLRKLRSIAEQALAQSCVNAVITVPANFNELQRMATRDAGRIAGLNVLRILNEPTAAALAYGYRAQSNQRIAVYDLGGGTFDISILELSGDVIEVVATAGDTYLGGDDIDRLLADRMVAEFLAKQGVDLLQDAQAYERVCMAAEWVKCQLSVLDSAEATVKEVAYAASGESLDLTFQLARTELDQMIFSLVGRTFDICADALRLASLRASQLDGVILVGGQTRTPKVRDMVAEYFGMQPQSSVDPDLVVAQGAALQGYALSGVKLAEAARPGTKTLSGPPPAPRPDQTLEYAKPAVLAQVGSADGFDDEPTRVAGRSDAPAAGQSSAPSQRRSETPFDELPTTVQQRLDDEPTKTGDLPVVSRTLPPPVPSHVPLASQRVSQPLKATWPGTGEKAPAPATVPRPVPSTPPTAAAQASAAVPSVAARASTPAALPGGKTLAETPTAKAGVRPSQLPSARNDSASMPAVPRARRLPAEAEGFPPVIDQDVTERDAMAEIKAQTRASVAPVPIVKSVVPAAPPTKTLAETPKAKAAARASVLPLVVEAAPVATTAKAESAVPTTSTPAVPPLMAAQAPAPAARSGVSTQSFPIAPDTKAPSIAATQSQFPVHDRAVSPLLLLDVTPHTLAVETAGGYCEQIIERNAPIPTEQTRIFSTSQDNQETVSMRVCQGEARRTDDNQVLGQLELLALRRARRGEVSIAVTFMIDADGTLNVKATDRSTSRAQALRINLVGALDDDDIERMRMRQGPAQKAR